MESREWEKGDPFFCVVCNSSERRVHARGVVRLVDSVLSTRRIGYVSISRTLSVLVYRLMMMALQVFQGSNRKISISVSHTSRRLWSHLVNRMRHE